MRVVSRGSLLRRRIVAIGAVLIAAFTVSAVVNVWRNYQHTLFAIDRELGNLSKTLAEQATRTFEAVEALLGEVERWQEANDGKAGREEGSARLFAFQTGSPVAGLYVSDAHGTVRYESRPLPAEPGAPDAGVTMLDGRPMLVVTRDVRRAGQFAGRVTALVDLAKFQEFYDAIDLGTGDTIGLLRDDGMMLARRPHTAGAVGRKYPELIQARDVHARREDKPALMTSPVDGQPRFFALTQVRGFPFVLMATRDAGAALAGWREIAIHAGVRTALLDLLGALLLAALVRQLARADAADQTVRESEARFRSLTELSSDWYWRQDENLRFTYVSSGAFDLGNYAAASTIGRARWELPNLTPLSFTWVEHQAVLAARQPFRDLEYRRGGLDGSTHYISISGAPIFDENGRFKGYQGIGRNITERKRAEAERVKLEERLRQAEKMQAIGTLAGGIAHDFNNILGAILGYGELAQRKAGESGPLREQLDQVMQAGNRGKRLVEQILAFSRSGVGERIPVHVQSVVEETLDLLAASLPPAIRLEKVLRSADAAVVGDATQLHQVTMNLCTNAVQAMPNGGVLSVTLERTDTEEARELTQKTLAPGPYVRLQVTDTGSGIPPAVLERIFDPFFTTKRVGEGTGLGLSLVHGIVADFGGAVDVETREGAGTTITVWLPASGEAPTRVVDAAGVLPHGNGEAVLIVDDERPLVNIAEEMLAGLGYEPIGFSSSVDALTAFRAEPERYDIVLTDETMPDLTGTDLAREIRRLRADIPIVLMSGYSGPQLTERARAAGVSDILRKPLVSRDIAEALARHPRARLTAGTR